MLLALHGVSKRFGALRALDGVGVEIGGRAVGLLGPNGAGKTTLMRVCLGLLTPDEGELRVLGIDARRDPGAVRMRLGYAAEGPHRIPGLSGLESVAYAGELCGLPRRTAILRAHEMLDLVGLDQARQRPVEEYSTGMHQRVKIAMALVHDPELLMLDEPTSGLDPGSRDELLQLIVRLRDGEGPAVLLSTHLLHDVETLCSEVGILHRGKLVAGGRMEELLAAATPGWRLSTADDARALDVLAHEVPAARPVREHDAVRIEGDEDTLAAAQAVLAQAGLPPHHVAPTRGSLERTFLDATEGVMG